MTNEAKRHILNIARTNQLVSDLIASGVEIVRARSEIHGYFQGQAVFMAKKGSFIYVCHLSNRVDVANRMVSA